MERYRVRFFLLCLVFYHLAGNCGNDGDCALNMTSGGRNHDFFSNGNQTNHKEPLSIIDVINKLDPYSVHFDLHFDFDRWFYAFSYELREYIKIELELFANTLVLRDDFNEVFSNFYSGQNNYFTIVILNKVSSIKRGAFLSNLKSIFAKNFMLNIGNMRLTKRVYVDFSRLGMGSLVLELFLELVECNGLSNKIHSLILSDNCLTKLPDKIFTLDKLRLLDLRDNHLVSIPRKALFAARRKLIF